MSIIFGACKTCSNGLTWEDVLLKAAICDGEGNLYFRTYDFSNTEAYCGSIEDYAIVSRTIDGVAHDGIYVTHSLGKSTGIFLTVTDNNGVTQNGISAEVISSDEIFIMLDGLTSGGFCVQ